MPIYDIYGNQLSALYDIEGNSLLSAYDVEGTLIWSEEVEPTGFKVMEYNVGQWYIGNGSYVPSGKDTSYYALQSGIIKRANADVVFLTEYLDQFSAGRTALSMLQQYYPYIRALGGESGYFGRAICSKYPLSEITQHSYSNRAERYYDSVVLSVGNDKITLVVTHLDTNATMRYAQVTELITYLNTLDKFICGGDFNTTGIIDSSSTGTNDYTNIINPLLNAGFHCANCESQFLPTYSAEPTGTYVGCLDNIVTSSNISIESVSVDTTKMTDYIEDTVDHIPLIAELDIDGSEL